MNINNTKILSCSEFLENVTSYIENGYIKEVMHPTADGIYIYNYTSKTQYERKWDDITMSARGLIIDKNNGKILARPFKKFFNLDEHKEMGLEIPDEEPIIEEKVDGSLGILWWNNGRPEIATRGSFNSEQAKWATQTINSFMSVGSYKYYLDKNKTYLFEICYPGNRIVIDYGKRKFLCLIGVIDTQTGKEENIDLYGHTLRMLHDVTFCVRNDNYSEFLYTNIIKHYEDINADKNLEGFVINFKKSGVRVKLKFDYYKKIHKVIGGMSTKSVWEFLKNNNEGIYLNTIVDGYDFLPPHIKTFIEKNANDIIFNFNEIEDEALEKFDVIKKELGDADREKYAERFNVYTFASILFKMLDRKDYRHIIWRIVKPKYDNKIVKDDDN